MVPEIPKSDYKYSYYLKKKLKISVGVDSHY